MRIAIIGLGSIGRRHLMNLLHLGERDIVIVSSHQRNKLYNVEGSLIPVVNDMAEIIDPIDAVVVSNETNLHQKYLELAVNNGIHAYVEKPVACNTDKISEIAKDAANKGLVIAIGTQFRFNEKLVKLKELLETDYFGRIISVMSTHGEHIADYHPDEDYRSGYAANQKKCGGVLLTQIHHIDYLDWLFGAFTHTYANEMPAPSLYIDTDAIINYSLVSDVTKLQVHGHINFLQRPKSTRLFVVGESGTASWDYERNTLRLNSDMESINDTSALDRNKMFLLAMSDFLDSIKSSTEPKANLNAGIRTLQIVESIKRSIDNNLPDRIIYS